MGNLFKVGASIIGGNSAKKASKKAQAAQNAAIGQAQNTLNAQQADAEAMAEPWTTGGTSAQSALLELLGLGSGGAEGQTAAIAALKESPVYKALFGNAVDATLANASATGGLRGGNTVDALARVGSDTLAKVYQDRVANLGSVSQMGLGAAGDIMDLGANNATAIANLFGKQGDVNAGGILQRSTINSKMLDTIASEAGKAADGGGIGKVISSIGKIF